MSAPVMGLVSVKVEDRHGSYVVIDELVPDIAAYIEHVEQVVVEDGSYCGPLTIAFLVEVGDEIDGFTRYYDQRQLIATV